MSAQGNVAPVIIKRKKVVAGGGHHGGAWKVAYADFVTAMMAFFLLMWLLNATTEKQRKGIADFFSPTIPVNRISGGGDGALGGNSVFTEETLARNGTGATSLRPTESNAARGSRTGEDGGDTGSSEELELVEDMLFGRGGESDIAPEVFKHIVTRVTDEGLAIDLFDLPGAPLFLGTGAEPGEVLKYIADMIVRVTGFVSNDIAVEAHMAARPVVVSNPALWEISSQRANVFRKLLQGGGLEKQRIERITGHADREPIESNPMATRNNRLEIILLRD